LEGLLIALQPSGLQADGKVGSRNASVTFDVLRPMSLVSQGCFLFPPTPQAVVRVPDFDFQHRNVSLVRVNDAQVMGRFLGPLNVELLQEDTSCLLVLGLDVLSDWAFVIDSEVGTVKLTKSDSQRLMDEGWVKLALTQEPVSGIPLLPIRLKLSDRRVPLVVGLSTANETRVSAELIPEAKLEAIELSPGLQIPVSLISTLTRPSRFDGHLGPDVWGKRDGLIDLAPGVYWVRRSP
jgi:hypothetical protein